MNQNGLLCYLSVLLAASYQYSHLLSLMLALTNNELTYNLSHCTLLDLISLEAHPDDISFKVGSKLNHLDLSQYHSKVSYMYQTQLVVYK